MISTIKTILGQKNENEGHSAPSPDTMDSSYTKSNAFRSNGGTPSDDTFVPVDYVSPVGTINTESRTSSFETGPLWSTITASDLTSCWGATRTLYGHEEHPRVALGVRPPAKKQPPVLGSVRSNPMSVPIGTIPAPADDGDINPWASHKPLCTISPNKTFSSTTVSQGDDDSSDEENEEMFALDSDNLIRSRTNCGHPVTPYFLQSAAAVAANFAQTSPRQSSTSRAAQPRRESANVSHEGEIDWLPEDMQFDLESDYSVDTASVSAATRSPLSRASSASRYRSSVHSSNGPLEEEDEDEESYMFMKDSTHVTAALKPTPIASTRNMSHERTSRIKTVEQDLF
eukprot:GFYU01001271.1.p1 GENE.GFYU01001271.1~~GFYU01001271.1.p1  ORF type:complete len:343 (+),score=43.53 GFYU01001271.1:215-1243(+)